MVKKKEYALLTEVELELMNLIWKLGECTVKDVQGALSPGRDLAYTSVATVMKILEHKGFLSSKRGEKAHGYRAKVDRSEYETTSLSHLTRQVFSGDATSMVMKLLNETDLDADALKAIRALVKERLAEK